MSTALHDFALVDDQNHIRILYGGQAVSDSHDGTLSGDVLNCFLNLSFCLYVYRGGSSSSTMIGDWRRIALAMATRCF